MEAILTIYSSETSFIALQELSKKVRRDRSIAQGRKGEGWGRGKRKFIHLTPNLMFHNI